MKLGQRGALVWKMLWEIAATISLCGKRCQRYGNVSVRSIMSSRPQGIIATGMENGEASTVGSSQDSGWCWIHRWAESLFFLWLNVSYSSSESLNLIPTSPGCTPTLYKLSSGLPVPSMETFVVVNRNGIIKTL